MVKPSLLINGEKELDQPLLGLRVGLPGGCE
jgi:hypothetical protein